MTTGLATGLTTSRTHLDAFGECEKSLPGHDRPALARLRRTAVARFGELGFPGERNEDWKFTNVGPLVRTPARLSSTRGRASFRASALPAGVVVTNLADALRAHPEVVERHLGQYADLEKQAFVALNTAMWNHDGLFVFVPPGTVVESPIHLDFLGPIDDDGLVPLTYRRLLVVVGKGSQVTLAECHGDGQGKRGIVNVVSEMVLDEGAQVDHYKVQEESEQVYHLATTQAVVAKQATFSTHYVGLGGALVRNEVRVLFAGERAEATVNGLYLASGAQHADNHTVIDHAKPHCASHELYKGILDGKAKGVFNGKIFVRPDAQKTDAKQTNKTLLLSDDAVIDTKPQLEIFADDVRCTHGATVGQLDEQQLFYLRARGIGLEQARSLLTFAFANDVIGRIKIPSLRERLENRLLATRQLPRLDDIEEER